jgi:HK97 family phage prohead protease
MDRLAFDCELKLAGDGAQAGTVEGYASMFNLLDRGGDIVLPGAFKASLADFRKRKSNPPMLWQHDPYTPVGVWTEVEEDEKGLKVKGELALDVPQAAAARALMLAGAVKGLSIGYRTIDSDVDRTSGVRTLKKVDLWEVSLVTFPMQREAQISGVKADFDPRELERELRSELKLSSAAAVRAVALFRKHLREGDGQPVQAARDGKSDLLMSLRKTALALR